MSRYAGTNLGIDITDFLGKGPDFTGLGNQAQVDNAKNFGLTEHLNAAVQGSIMQGQAKVEAAKLLGEAQVAGVPSAGQQAAGGLIGAVGSAPWKDIFGSGGATGGVSSDYHSMDYSGLFNF